MTTTLAAAAVMITAAFLLAAGTCAEAQPDPPLEPVISSTVVMRHCLRSTPFSMPGGALGFTSFDNYTDKAWPDWCGATPS